MFFVILCIIVGLVFEFQFVSASYLIYYYPKLIMEKEM